MDSPSVLVLNPNPDSIPLLDILLPPLLLALALIIYDIQNNKPSHSTHDAHIFRATTTHQRLHPSTHRFTYKVLLFGFDLNQLESARLDVPHLFRFNNSKHRISCFDPSSWLKLLQIFSISPSSYHQAKADKSHPAPDSIKSPLFDQLRNQFGILDVDDQIGKVYLITMPTYLGYSTINPLSIYFCYQKVTDLGEHHPLKYVVLDVQNTFSERHSYLLTVGINESSDCPSGFHHEWTIPRAFHVSPFNDRSGFYKVSISDPFSNIRANPGPESKAKINVKIVLLTATFQKKFVATLNGTGTPFSRSELVRTWLHYPIILFLTTVRILYQALILHLGKPRLDVFPKPDPAFDPDHGLKGPNPIQMGAQIGATGWQEPDWCARRSKKIVVDYLKQRVNQIAQTASQSIPPPSLKSLDLAPDRQDELSSLGSFEQLNPVEQLSSSQDEDEGDQCSMPTPPAIVNVILKPADQTQETIVISPDGAANLAAEELVIDYGSESFFTDLVVFPTPSLARVVCDCSEASWKVGSIGAFERVFEPAGGREARLGSARGGWLERHVASGVLRRAIVWMRMQHVNWQLAFVTVAERESAALKTRCSWLAPPTFLPIVGAQRAHTLLVAPSPLDPPADPASLLAIFLVIAAKLASDAAYYTLAHRLLPVRFAPLTHPWLRLRRAVLAKSRPPSDPLGSVRHPS